MMKIKTIWISNHAAIVGQHLIMDGDGDDFDATLEAIVECLSPGWSGISLTPRQREMWDWAKSAANEYWTSGEADLTFEQEPVGDDGRIANSDEVIDDMIYRLDDQLSEMADAAGGIGGDGPNAEARKAQADKRHGKAVAKKLRPLIRPLPRTG